MSEWIDVKERMPADGVEVMICDALGLSTVLQRENGKWVYEAGCEIPKDAKILRWLEMNKDSNE